MFVRDNELGFGTRIQPFSQDYSLASHTTYVLCVNFIRMWWDLEFNVDSERQIFEKLFQGFLFSEFLKEICWEEIGEEIFFFSYFVLMPDLGYEPELYVWQAKTLSTRLRQHLNTHTKFMVYVQTSTSWEL